MSSQYIVPDVSMKLDHTPTPMSPLRKVTTAKVDETGNRIGIVVKGLSGDAHDILSKEANFSALSTLLRTEEAVRNFRNISSYTTTIGLAEICPGLEDPNSVITAIETKIIITVITDWAGKQGLVVKCFFERDEKRFTLIFWYKNDAKDKS